MSAPWNYNVQQELEPQPLNMALLLLQQELAELGSSVPANRQFQKEDHVENIPTKHLEPSISIKEEPQSLTMNYAYSSNMPNNFNMVPQMWQLPQIPHLQRMEQNFSDLPEKTILNLDDVKDEIMVEKCNINNEIYNQAPECNKCNMPQYPQEPLYKNDMYPKRVCATENFYNFSSIPYPGPSNTWYSVKTFAGREQVNRWDVQAENMRNYNNSVVDRNMPSSPVLTEQTPEQGEVIQGPMAHPDQFPMCRVCGKGFATKEQLMNHMMVHRNRKPHVCEICEKSFSSPGNLKTHIMIHTGQKPHSCEKCGKRFTTLGNLKTHSVVHTAEKPHPCQVCGKGFTTLGNLKTHLLIHTGERPYICEVCGKRFTTRGNVKAHSVTHTSEKPYVCHVCGKNFSHKGNLKTHIVSRHLVSKQLFDCVVCGRTFSQVETLNTHVALVHPGTPVPQNGVQEDVCSDDPQSLTNENIISV